MPAYHDMHCHLGFMPNAVELAADARERGTLLFANTVTPTEYAELRDSLAGLGNVTVGFGLHPWWVDGAGEQDAAGVQGASGYVPSAVIDLLERHDPTFVGEVGLDFGWRHEHSRAQQVEVFSAIATWAANRGGKVMSVHSVKAAFEAFDVLAGTGALESCTCVFHWFTGPSDLLKRAVQAGCYFSCGKRMLATGKGREYVKAIPAARLLLETDAPPEQGMPYSYDELAGDLRDVAQAIAAIKGPDVLDVIAETSSRLLSAGGEGSSPR